MKVFVTLLIPLVFNKIFLTELLLFVSLFSMSLQAETRYLFPSDITDDGQCPHRVTSPKKMSEILSGGFGRKY